MINVNAKRRAFTITELLIAIVVFGLVSTVVFKFTSWMNESQALSAWKQSAQDSLRLNEVFWQKHFAGATMKLDTLVTDAQGVIQLPPNLATSPVKIRNGGTGNLLAAYVNTGAPWPLWQFKTFHKLPGLNQWEAHTVTAYIKGAFPYITLYGREEGPDSKVISNMKLIENLVSIDASTREYPDEHLTVLTMNFLLRHPRRSDIVMKKTSVFKISTSLEPF